MNDDLVRLHSKAASERLPDGTAIQWRDASGIEGTGLLPYEDGRLLLEVDIVRVPVSAALLRRAAHAVQAGECDPRLAADLWPARLDIEEPAFALGDTVTANVGDRSWYGRILGETTTMGGAPAFIVGVIADWDTSTEPPVLDEAPPADFYKSTTTVTAWHLAPASLSSAGPDGEIHIQ